jgi:hypothetical protein
VGDFSASGFPNINIGATLTSNQLSTLAYTPPIDQYGVGLALFRVYCKMSRFNFPKDCAP